MYGSFADDFVEKHFFVRRMSFPGMHSSAILPYLAIVMVACHPETSSLVPIGR